MSGAASARRDGSLRWAELPPERRFAWTALGWDAGKWDGDEGTVPPLSELLAWDELTPAQRGAAEHGLGYTAAEWDADDDHLTSAVAVRPDGAVRQRHEAAPPAVPEAQHHPGGSLASTLLGLAPTVAKALEMVRGAGLVSRATARTLRAAEEAVWAASSVADSMAGAVALTGVENAVYLDDSGSMTPALLRAGTLVLDRLAPSFARQQTRVIKFGWDKTVLQPRSLGYVTSARLHWDATSGGTVMWRTIQQDVLTVWKHGAGKLRLYVLTDGHDIETGLEGMHPMMRTIVKAGLDVEFHIIVLNDKAPTNPIRGGNQSSAVSAADAQKYRDLALATGGSFLNLDVESSAEDFLGFFADSRDDALLNRPDVREFIHRSNNDGNQARQLARSTFEREKGRPGKKNHHQVPWYDDHLRLGTGR